MPKEFDNKVLNNTIMGVVASTFEKMLHIKASVAPVATEKDIIEFDSRMRLFPMEKFNGPCFVSVVNYYLSQKDLEDQRAIGTFIFYIKEDVAEKLLRAFNRSIKDAEHEDVLMDVVSEMASILAGNVKNELAANGYIDLVASPAHKHKNHVSDGVLFDYNLYQKQEIAFTFWGHKCIVIEACLGNVPNRTM